ncbi:MAG: DUF938 domain-containing protein [Nannocystaceae bacterium]
MTEKLFYPAASRNRAPLLDALRDTLHDCEQVLEVASGSGEHVEHLAAAFPRCTFHPTDIADECLASLLSRAGECATGNIATPARLDVTEGTWPEGPFDAVLNANMIHISPWACCEGLLRGASAVLRPGGHLCLYGPFRRAGRPTAPSNERFSNSLRARDPRWGVRVLEDVVRSATPHGLALVRVTDMPANNLTVLFQRTS